MRAFGTEDIGARDSHYVTLKDGLQKFRVIPVPTGKVIDGKPEMTIAYEKGDQFWADSLDEKGKEMRRPITTRAEREVNGTTHIDKFTQEDAAAILLPNGTFLSEQYSPKTSFRTLVWDYQLEKLLILRGPAWKVFDRLGQFHKEIGPLTSYDIQIRQTTEGGFPQRQTDPVHNTIGKKIPDDVRAKITAAIAADRDDLLREMVFTVATVDEVAKVLNGQVVRDPNERMRLAQSIIPEGTDEGYVDPFEGGAGQDTGTMAEEADAFAADDDGLDF